MRTDPWTDLAWTYEYLHRETGRARAVALDDRHGRVVRQFAPQLQFGLEVANLTVERVALVVHRLHGKFVRRDVGLLLAREQRAL